MHHIGTSCDIRFVMQRFTTILIPCFLAILMLITGCAHFPLNMTEEEWERLTPQQQMDARERQAKLDQERALQREKLRLEQEAKEAEQARLEEQQDIDAGMIARFGEICIGGSRCPDSDKKEHIYSLRQFVYVDKIVFSAHDNIGNKHNGTIDIFADRIPIAENVDIKRTGGEQTLFIGEITRNIIFKIRNDDEVKIRQLKIFGSPLKLDNPKFIITQ